MKQLSDEIKITGIGMSVKAKLVKRTKKKAIYERSDDVWEVFLIKQQKEGEATFEGVKVHYEEKELYPNNEDFGKIAWCFTNYNRAIKRYEAL